MKSTLFSIVVAAVSMSVVIWMFSEDENNHQQVLGKKSLLPEVTAITMTPESYQHTVKFTGIVTPYFPSQITSAVSGRLNFLEEQSEPGMRLVAHKVIAQLDDKNLQYEYLTAQSRVAQAKLSLARYQHEQSVVKTITPAKNSNSFGLFVPHIEAAKAELAAAKAQLKYTKQQLSFSQITMPYDAVIVERYLSPDQWINAGDPLFKIASSKEFNIEVNLPANDWQQVMPLTAHTQITVQNSQQYSWPAKLRYIKPELNSRTKQHQITLAVAQHPLPNIALNFGQEVQVLIKGKQLSDIVVAPQTVVTQDATVWTIEQGKLKQEAVTVIDEKGQKVAFKFIEQPEKIRTIALYPMSTFIAGQAVKISMKEIK